MATHEARPVLLSEEDAEVLDRLRAGDEAAFADLLDQHHASMVRVARAYVASTAVAEEVAQETWVGVIDGVERFEGRSSLKTWIFRILVNRAKTRGVREGRSVPFSALEDHESHEAVDPARFQSSGRWADPPRRWDDDTPERLLLQRETMRLLGEAIDALPPNYRAVLVLRDVEGLDALDICNILEISETNQRVLLHRARTRVRRALEAHLDGK